MPVGTSPEDQVPSSTSTSQNQNFHSVSNDEVLSDVISTTTPTTTRTRPRVNYQNLHRYGSVFSVDEADPLLELRTFEEATQGHLTEEWKRAIRSELTSIRTHETWEVVSLPSEDISPITTKWVFTIKKDSHQMQGTTYCSWIPTRTRTRLYRNFLNCREGRISENSLVAVRCQRSGNSSN
jgi:hypothetical protein